MLEVRLNGYDLAPVLVGAPQVSDQMAAACRTMNITVQKTAALGNNLGQPVGLWRNGVREFYGYLFKRSFESKGTIGYTVVEPLVYLKENPDDYYFKNMTATQAFRQLCSASGITVGSLANTGAVLPQLYYQGKQPDKIAVDLLARTYQLTGKKYWYRFNPEDGPNLGFNLFEQVIPVKVWAFQPGINLLSATYEESIEETKTIVKLVNRDTGKVVTKINTDFLARFGSKKYFEEVQKDAVDTMDRKGTDLLAQKSKIGITMSIEGTSPGGIMPQLFSGDVVYAEEGYTGLLGAYYVVNITQTYASANLVNLALDLQYAPLIPEIQYDDATTDPAAAARAT